MNFLLLKHVTAIPVCIPTCKYACYMPNKSMKQQCYVRVNFLNHISLEWQGLEWCSCNGMNLCTCTVYLDHFKEYTVGCVINRCTKDTNSIIIILSTQSILKSIYIVFFGICIFYRGLCAGWQVLLCGMHE